MNEMSSQDLPYRSMPNLANVTFVGAGHDNAIVLNQGTVVGYYNAVITGGLPACVEFQSATTEGTFDSTYLSCDVPFAGGDAGAEAAAFAVGRNNSTGHSTLTGTFINGANEAALPAHAGLAAINASLVDVAYIGAVTHANDTWWPIGRAH